MSQRNSPYRYYKYLFGIGNYFIGKHNKNMTHDRFLFIGKFSDKKYSKVTVVAMWNIRRRR